VCVFLQIAAVPAEGTASTDSLQPTNGNSLIDDDDDDDDDVCVRFPADRCRSSRGNG
jgi:hypothetical protein